MSCNRIDLTHNNKALNHIYPPYFNKYKLSFFLNLIVNFKCNIFFCSEPTHLRIIFKKLK